MEQDTGHKAQVGATGSKKGQMSLIMIVAVAIGLILFAISMNWGRTTATKTQATIAANIGAARLASSMASYGEAKLQGELGGSNPKCGWAGWLASLLTFLIVMIATIIVVTSGNFAAASLIMQIAVISAAVMATVSLAINVLVIDPSITRLWNKAQQNIKSTEGQFLEGGIQTLLQSAVSDSAKVPDYFDGDADGLWYPQDPKEKIARFAYFYNERMALVSSLDSPEWDVFRTAIGNLGALLGITQTENSACRTTMPSLCDSCCVGLNSAGKRDAGCSQDPVPSTCSTNAPRPMYPLSYDPLFWPMTTTEGDMTLVKFLGEDDGSLYARKDNPAQPFHEVLESTPLLRGNDSIGEVFPLLWWMADTNTKIKDLDATTITENDPACHWCSSDGVSSCQGANAGLFWKSKFAEVSQLSLTEPCEGDGCCVNWFANDPADLTSLDTRQIDKVPAIDAFIKEDQPTNCPGTGGNGIWRKGWDIECTNVSTGTPKVYTAPYYTACDKWVGTGCSSASIEDPALTCECSQSAHKDKWRDDSLDNVVWELRELAVNLKPYLTGGAALASSVSEWYMEVLGGIRAVAPVTGLPEGVEITAEGATIVERMTTWRDALGTWLDQDYTEGNLWCLPPEGAAGDMTTAEKDAIKGGTTEWGKLPSVINCLNYNSNNAEAFRRCDETCGTGTCDADICRDLPRSLVAGFNPNSFSNSDEYKGNIAKSYELAINQSPKFQKRAVYLQALYNQTKSIYDYLDEKIPQIQTLAQAAADALKALQTADQTEVKMSNYAIYGWKTKRPDTGREGLWHLVKVEANVPLRCDGDEKILRAGWSCGTDKFPWVRSYKRGSFKRCYEMTNTDGCVMVRVTRYDEDHPTDSAVTFFNNLPLWRFINRHPQFEGDGAPTGLGSCVRTRDISRGIEDAFMINGHQIDRVNIDGANIMDYDDFVQERSLACRPEVVKALKQGFVTDSCAKYYLEGGVYKLRFVDCSTQCEGMTIPE